MAYFNFLKHPVICYRYTFWTEIPVTVIPVMSSRVACRAVRQYKTNSIKKIRNKLVVMATFSSTNVKFSVSLCMCFLCVQDVVLPFFFFFGNSRHKEEGALWNLHVELKKKKYLPNFYTRQILWCMKSMKQRGNLKLERSDFECRGCFFFFLSSTLFSSTWGLKCRTNYVNTSGLQWEKAV